MFEPDENQDFLRNGGEDTLSRKALVELLRAVTEKGVPFRFQAPGFSMYPLIRNCDTITISPLPSDRPQLGDVVAFFRPRKSKLVVHRVIGRIEDCYITKGDNNGDPDGLIPRKNILGYVTAVQRHGRDIYFGSGPIGAMIAIASRYNLLRRPFIFGIKFIRPILRRMRI